MVLDSGNFGDDELIFNPALASLHMYLGGMDRFSRLVSSSRGVFLYVCDI